MTILFTMLTILTLLLSYMIAILFRHMVRIFYNIVTILAIFTILCNNIVITYCNNIVTILFTLLSKSKILLTVLLQCVDHIVSNLGEVF